jgi:hypothetical protein
LGVADFQRAARQNPAAKRAAIVVELATIRRWLPSAALPDLSKMIEPALMRAGKTNERAEYNQYSNAQHPCGQGQYSDCV